jgi:hypothetical protein
MSLVPLISTNFPGGIGFELNNPETLLIRAARLEEQPKIYQPL